MYLLLVPGQVLANLHESLIGNTGVLLSLVLLLEVLGGRSLLGGCGRHHCR